MCLFFICILIARWNSHENNHPGLCPPAHESRAGPPAHESRAGPPAHESRAGTIKVDSCSFHVYKFILILKVTWNPHDLVIMVCYVCIMGISSIQDL
ncbi:MAG: hypothetical protein IPL55_23155 [Saprospiraceae bacterium]|nr:hypothetical protein [Saprospiraceae bacterium]